jgi:FkbM family methyltransferase
MEIVPPVTYPILKEQGVPFYGSETIQMDTEHFLHLLLGKKPEDIRTVVVVGAWKGDEIVSFLAYPNASIYCFEPNPKTFYELKTRYAGLPRVFCFPYACASSNATATLHHTDAGATDSLLEISDSAEFKEKGSYEVLTRRLDGISELTDLPIDLLWMDVQGFELEVLKGSTGLFSRIESIFAEVNNNLYQYKNAVPYRELKSFLSTEGFHAVAEGLDDETQGGNALFMKSKAPQMEKLVQTAPERLAPYVHEAYRKKKLFSFPFMSWFMRYTPSSIKKIIKKFLKFN